MTNKEAIKAIQFFQDEYDSNNCGHLDKALDMAKEALETQKIGHWVKYCRPRCGEQHYQCTSCGYYINFGQWGELYTKEFKYCPNCGLKMEGENK